MLKSVVVRKDFLVLKKVLHLLRFPRVEKKVFHLTRFLSVENKVYQSMRIPSVEKKYFICLLRFPSVEKCCRPKAARMCG